MRVIAKPISGSRRKPLQRRPKALEAVPETEESDWAIRSNYWLEQAKRLRIARGPRQRSAPLILCGHGIKLNVDRGTLLTRDGFSHYPQTRSEHRIFPGDPNRPTRILVVDGSGSITFDVVDWLVEQDIPLVRVDWRGAAAVMAGRAGYCAGGKAWRQQIAQQTDPRRRLAMARQLIERKLSGGITTLRGCIADTSARSLAIEVIGEKLKALGSRQPLNLSQLHGIEGRAAKVYFNAWVGTPLNWKTSRRHPIPAAWREIGQRQSMVSGKKGKNYGASHPINAMLNYAYAVLESQVRLSVIAQGLDPQTGYLHSGRRGQPSLVLDLMEPLRPKADAAVLGFAQAAVFGGADFVLRSDGVVRLSPQLAKTLVARLDHAPPMTALAK